MITQIFSKQWLLSLFFISATALAQPTLSPKQAIEQLYRHYLSDDNSVYFGETGDKRIISQRLAHELQEDNLYTLPGDMGFLDYDPLCGCQDYEDPSVEIVQATQSDATHAEATVRFHPIKNNNDEMVLITLKLVAEAERWMIDDVSSSDDNDGTSFYQRLEEQNNKIRTQLAALQQPQPQVFLQRIYEQLPKDYLPWTAMVTPTLRQAATDYQLAESNSGKTFEDPHIMEYLTGNPLCGCNEEDFQKVSSINIVEQNDQRTKIHVTYLLANNQRGERDIVLSNINNRWVIADILLPQEGSLLQRNRAR